MGMSFPSASISNHHQISALDFPEAARRYRRFSNVSDAVSRKLSTTGLADGVCAGGGDAGEVVVWAAYQSLAQAPRPLHQETRTPEVEKCGQPAWRTCCR